MQSISKAFFGFGATKKQRTVGDDCPISLYFDTFKKRLKILVFYF